MKHCWMLKGGPVKTASGLSERKDVDHGARAEGDECDVLYACRYMISPYIQGTIPIRISEHHYVPVACSIVVRPI
jgi:hypothetical protein